MGEKQNGYADAGKATTKHKGEPGLARRARESGCV